MLDRHSLLSCKMKSYEEAATDQEEEIRTRRDEEWMDAQVQCLMARRKRKDRKPKE